MDVLADTMAAGPVPVTHKHPCRGCGEPATLCCQRCKHSEIKVNGVHAATWYCSKECQKNAWSSHKGQCRDVANQNQLYRAAHFAQQVFYIYRKQAFDVPIQRIEFKGNSARIYGGKPGLGMLFHFPTALVTTREDEEAFLSYGACESALIVMHRIFTLALQGIHKDVEEISFNLKNPKRRIFLEGAPPPFYLISKHLILRVVLKTSNKYAIDVSGAQFGYHEPLMLWEEYESQRVQEIEGIYRFGAMKSEYDNLGSTAFGGNAHVIALLMNVKAIGHQIDLIIKGWLQSEGTELAAVLKLEADTYNAKSSTLLKLLDDGLAGYVRTGGKNKDLVVAVEKQHRNGLGQSYIVMGDGSKKSLDAMMNERRQINLDPAIIQMFSEVLLV